MNETNSIFPGSAPSLPPSPAAAQAPQISGETPLPLSSQISGGTPLPLLGRLAALESTEARLDTPATQTALRDLIALLAKPGWKTTEFWLHLFAAISVLSMAMAGVLQGTAAATLLAVGLVTYTLSRALAKTGLSEALGNGDIVRALALGAQSGSAVPALSEKNSGGTPLPLSGNTGSI